MLTMNHAMEQDRDIFAVPGPLDAPLSEGTNYLIQQGAKLVTCGGDILSEYWARFPRRLAASARSRQRPRRARLDSLAQDREENAALKPALEEVPSREFIPRSGQRERFTDDELSLLNALEDRTLSPDQLVELTQIPAKRVLSALTMLQIQGAAGGAARQAVYLPDAAGGVAPTLIPCDLRERNVPLIFPSPNLEVFQSCQIKRI